MSKYQHRERWRRNSTKLSEVSSIRIIDSLNERKTQLVDTFHLSLVRHFETSAPPTVCSVFIYILENNAAAISDERQFVSPTADNQRRRRWINLVSLIKKPFKPSSDDSTQPSKMHENWRQSSSLLMQSRAIDLKCVQDIRAWMNFSFANPTHELSFLIIADLLRERGGVGIEFELKMRKCIRYSD